jgi:hypothetical protein
MSQETATSRNGVQIRLPDERWQHIIEEHAELAALRDEVVSSIGQADRVLAGTAGELLAILARQSSSYIAKSTRMSDL